MRGAATLGWCSMKAASVVVVLPRTIAPAARKRAEKAHENDLRSVRAQLESDMERREKSTELRVKGLEEGAQEELEELRTEAQDKIQELEGAIEEELQAFVAKRIEEGGAPIT